MTGRIDRFVEVLNVVMRGFVSAVPLACVAFGVQRVGWHALPLFGFPLYSAYLVGLHKARTKWMVFHEARMLEIEKQIQGVARTMDELEKERGAETLTDDECLHMFTIYENPTDYPGRFVVRESVIGPGSVVTNGTPIAIVTSLEDARACVPPGLYRQVRADEDEPQIIECWF